MRAELGSKTFGISWAPFLDENFQTVSFEVKATLHDDGRFSYEEGTVLRMRAQDELFHHTDGTRSLRSEAPIDLVTVGRSRSRPGLRARGKPATIPPCSRS